MSQDFLIFRNIRQGSVEKLSCVDLKIVLTARLTGSFYGLFLNFSIFQPDLINIRRTQTIRESKELSCQHLI